VVDGLVAIGGDPSSDVRKGVNLSSGQSTRTGLLSTDVNVGAVHSSTESTASEICFQEFMNTSTEVGGGIVVTDLGISIVNDLHHRPEH
jgi:hypothetical protein